MTVITEFNEEELTTIREVALKLAIEKDDTGDQINFGFHAKLTKKEEDLVNNVLEHLHTMTHLYTRAGGKRMHLSKKRRKKTRKKHGLKTHR
jgi:hypothetical protein